MTRKNKFQLKGRYKSSGGDGIPIGAFNVPRGSVVVTAGGRTLIEGVDYVVNLQKEKQSGFPSAIIRLANDGTVKIIRE